MLLFLLSVADESKRKKLNIFIKATTRICCTWRARLKTAGDLNYAVDCEDVVQNAFLKITKYVGFTNRRAARTFGNDGLYAHPPRQIITAGYAERGEGR